MSQENWSYNIDENHNYNDLDSNYIIIAADNKSRKPDLTPIAKYDIVSDNIYTGPKFKTTDGDTFDYNTDYRHRLHYNRFPVLACSNGIKDGITLIQPHVIDDNETTTVIDAPLSFRLSFSPGTVDYRTPVEYQNGISVNLTDGSSYNETEITRNIGESIPTTDYTFSTPTATWPSVIKASDLTPSTTVNVDDTISLNPPTLQVGIVTNADIQEDLQIIVKDYNLYAGFAIFNNAPIDDTTEYELTFTYNSTSYTIEHIINNSREGYFQEIFIDQS